MRVGNSDIYGFLEPQSIQRSGQSQFESEKLDVEIKTRCLSWSLPEWMVVLVPNEHLVIWFYSFHNRPDNYHKGIINSALKGLDDAPQPKSKAPARWIVVKCNRQKGSTECGYYYFNNPRPLKLERLKALRIQWAQYFLRVRDQT
ncbi:hypothetical protein GmHk_07G019124 [Glycine max]|nr:hypothetical protein GmHk_07G019124 [Glycine max]